MTKDIELRRVLCGPLRREDFRAHPLEGWAQCDGKNGHKYRKWLKDADYPSYLCCVITFSDDSQLYWLRIGSASCGCYHTPELAARMAKKLLLQLKRKNLNP